MTAFEKTRAPVSAERWRHGPIPVIGLTGGIAGGKSEVARVLAMRGCVVIDADSVGHALFEDDAVRREVIERLGTGVLAREDASAAADSQIDRKNLGAIVFAYPEARRALEAILHPRMRASFFATIQAVEQDQCAPVGSIVIDAAVLLEAGWNELCDRVVFVDAPRALRVDRAARQRGWSYENFRSREQAQWPIDEKRRRADFVITNDGRVEDLGREVDRLDALLAAAPAMISRDSVGAQSASPAIPITKEGGY
jgi:dephospho-CoA kinase